MPIRTLAIILIATTALAGCGRRGSLEAPGEAEAVSSLAAQTTSPIPGEPLLTGPVSPGAQEPPRAAPATAPQRRFVLDFLL